MSETTRHGTSLLPFVSLVPIFIAAAMQKTQGKIRADLRRAGATEPARAIALDPQRRFERSSLERMIDNGVVRRSGTLYYLDETAEMTCRERRQRRLLVMLAILLAAIGIGAALVVFGRHR